MTINSAAENQWVFDTFVTVAPDEEYGVWIGFWDGQEEGLYRWISGEPVVYTNWDNGQPTDHNEGAETGQDFGHIFGITNFRGPGEWNDFSGSDELAGVVERPLVGTDPGTFKTDMWLTDWIVYNGFQYRLTAPMSWLAAELQARNNEAHLVTVDNESENSWLYNTFLAPRDFITGSWIGLWDGQQEGSFRWIDGTALTYTNWSASQPDNSFIHGEDFATINGVAVSLPFSKWNDFGGSDNLPGIVERRIPNAIATHSGGGERHVPVTIASAGQASKWDFGVITPSGQFIPSWQIRQPARDGGTYRLGFKLKGSDGETIPIDDPRVSVEGWREQPDGTFHTLGLALDANSDGLSEFEVTLQVKNLQDSLEPIHLNDSP